MIWIIAFVVFLIVCGIVSEDKKIYTVENRPHFKLTLDGQTHLIGYRQRYVFNQKNTKP